jgi:WD40 repeat protein
MIGTGLSDYSCIIYSVGEFLSRTFTLNHNQPITGIKFSSTSKNIFYVATEDGLITAYDLRANGQTIAEFKGIKSLVLTTINLSKENFNNLFYC